MKDKLKVCLNGLGRIGRHIFKMCIDDPTIQLVGINEINPDLDNWTYTLNYDSIYGQANEKSFVKDGKILHKGLEIYTSREKDITKIPLKDWDVDLIIDSSGVLQNTFEAKKIINESLAKKVIFTNSPENVDFTMILGVNEKYKPLEHNLIASSICDATAIAPISKLIHDNYQINLGYITTLHPWLSYQNLMDGPSSSWSVPGEVYHHYALGRSAVGNIIPKPTSAVDAVTKVIPSLKGKIGSFSYRTPTQVVGSADITFFTEKEINKFEILDILENFQTKQNFPVIKISNSPLVSMDYIGEKYSAIVDTRWLNVIDSKLMKIVLWYDNEYGYSCNVMNQIKYIHSLL